MTGLPPLARRALTEAVGTGLLVMVVVGSGIAAQRLSTGQAGLQLLENAAATAAGLVAIILMVGPVSGAHLNPLVSVGDWWLGRRHRAGGALAGSDLAAYLPAQVAGGIAGAMLANLMYDLPAVTWSTTARSGGHLWLAEVVASAGLVLLVFALVRSGRTGYAAAAVGAYIGAACWFTSSTSFANPAVTIRRMFTDTFAGISPSSVPGFVLAQVAGLLVGVGLVLLFYPRRRAVHAAEVNDVVPGWQDAPPAYPDLDAKPGGPLPGLPLPTPQGRPW